MNKKYYVTMIDGKKYVKLVGPIDNHKDAIAIVDDVREYVTTDRYPQYFFCEFGTCSVLDGKEDGALNDVFLNKGGTKWETNY